MAAIVEEPHETIRDHGKTARLSGNCFLDVSWWNDVVSGVTLDSDSNLDLLETVQKAVSVLWDK